MIDISRNFATSKVCYITTVDFHTKIKPVKNIFVIYKLVGWVKPNNFLSAKTVQFCARKVTFGVV